MSEDMDLTPEDLAAFRAWQDQTKAAPPQQRGPATKKGEGKPPSVADQLISMADSQYEFGTSDAGDLYAVPRNGPRIARLLRGGRISLRAELARTYYSLHGKAASSSALADAMLAIEGRAQAEDPVPLHLRVAPLGKRPEDGFLLDLGRADGLVVTVTPKGWTVAPAAPGQPLFRRSQLTQPLPIPKGGGSLTELRGLLNVTDQSWPLLVSWLVAGLVPGIPHPLLFLSGEQGTAKSTATKMLVSLLDPSAAPARSTPKDPDDWSTAAVGSWVVGLDNLSRIPEWLSDAMCRAATGDANVKRTLYSDSDVTVQEFRRVLIVNGIDVGTLRGDLADRMIPVHLHRITQRRTETALWEAYHDAQPRIVGALLNLLVRTLEALPEVREKADKGEIPLPRMADYGLIMAALDKVSGSQTTSILSDYLQQRTELAEEVVESNQVATTLLNLMKRQPPTGESGSYEWEGTTAELLDVLTHDVGITNDKWPRTPGALSGRINRVASDLDKLGVDITRQKSGSKRSITIRYIPRPDPSIPQPAAEPVQEALMQ
ncbi:ATP-binding protein [Streptomyces sp. NPDC006632]|uniref:ATP-binding protein n=1 Tax=Streptomyces sp. NPDC006632 TaxID=3157182 RepID=UPI0033B98131